MMGLYFRGLMVGETMLKPVHRHLPARLVYLTHQSSAVGYAPAVASEKAVEGISQTLLLQQVKKGGITLLVQIYPTER